jgi:anti-sigma factor RsiW
MSGPRHVVEWLAAARDGELTPEEQTEMEAHLATCPDCAAHQAAMGALQQDLVQLPYRPAPPGLAERIQSALPQESDAAEQPRWRRPPAWRRMLLPLTASAAALLLAWNLSLQMQRPGSLALAEQVVDSHVRSLMVDHLTDVASSDQHTVKPWFSGKLDLAPPVVDLAEQGFPLIGGRLDYLDARPVAALVFRRHEHVINVFLLPGRAEEAAPQLTSLRGYALLHWSRGGLEAWAVSDVNSTELRQLAELLSAAQTAP